MSSTEDLPGLLDRLTELHFPESSRETREKFSNDLLGKIGKLRRTRTFSIESDEHETSDAGVQTPNHFTPDSSPGPMIKIDDDRDILSRLFAGEISHRALEVHCDPSRAVNVRRKYLRQFADLNLDGLPFREYDYKDVNGACCENLIGYIPMPTGVVGPLNINGTTMYVPMSTTEGALIASTNRGCKALVNGVTSSVFGDKMTRSPILQFHNITDAAAFKDWIERPDIYEKIRLSFEGTSRFCKLVNIVFTISGDNVYLRFTATTGDAMGMNMVSKATSAALDFIKAQEFKDKFKILSLSGNMCVDKKASALNWIEGRGKTVVAEATIPFKVIESTLRCNPKQLVELSNAKLNIGSSASVCIGGSNAHAANIVAAMFIATGQDAAQVVSSSMCCTEIRMLDDNELKITCTMNCLEVGTVGGGTILGPQRAMLKMLGCTNLNVESGSNAKRLAKIICATVLAGELSLLAAQCSNDLVKSHMKFNRSTIFNQLPVKSMENNISNNTLAPNGERSLRKFNSCHDKNSCMTSIL